MERRDEQEEERISQRGLRNSRASFVLLSPFGVLRHQNREWRAAGMPNLVSARTRRYAGREQGLKILAREVNKNAVRNAPTSQANWLWDCTTPDTALAGISVSVGAIAFWCKTANSGPSFPQLFPCVTARIPAHIQPHSAQTRRSLGTLETALWFAPAISHAGR